MATSDKSSSHNTILNHVELGTNPTGEGKNSESTFSNGAEEIKEDGISTNMTNSRTTSSLQTTITETSPVQPPAREVIVTTPLDSLVMRDNQSEDEVFDATIAGQSTVSTPAPTSTKGPLESNGELDTEVTTPVNKKGSSDGSRIVSIDEASHLQELLSSPEGNNQIVERSPGERYVRFSEKLGSGASKDVYRAYDTEEGIEVPIRH